MHFLLVETQVRLVSERSFTNVAGNRQLLMNGSFVEFQIVVACKFFPTLPTIEVPARVFNLSVLHERLSRLVPSSAYVAFIIVRLNFRCCRFVVVLRLFFHLFLLNSRLVSHRVILDSLYLVVLLL